MNCGFPIADSGQASGGTPLRPATSSPRRAKCAKQTQFARLCRAAHPRLSTSRPRPSGGGGCAKQTQFRKTHPAGEICTISLFYHSTIPVRCRLCKTNPVWLVPGPRGGAWDAPYEPGPIAQNKANFRGIGRKRHRRPERPAPVPARQACETKPIPAGSTMGEGRRAANGARQAKQTQFPGPAGWDGVWGTKAAEGNGAKQSQFPPGGSA
jgi:hypothetical protein